MKRDIRTPIQSLVAVQRVHLKAGESKTIDLSIARDRLHVTDAQGKQYISPGDCTISVGGSQNDPRSAALLNRSPLSATISLSK
jgi:beta-glucosidase